jgi:ATP-dependent exoDNAse (exonuclease V) beta subunit
MKGSLPDAHIREAVLDPRESFHVESPAGAGKTRLLTARFVRLLGEVDHPREILALTFTNKAANEMLGRVQSLLRQAEEGWSPDSKWSRQEWEAARRALEKHQSRIQVLKSPDGLNITTFHSFCSWIVKQAPLEAQVPMEAVVLTDKEQELWAEEAAGRVLDDLAASPVEDPLRQALERVLLYYNNTHRDLAADLTRLTLQRDRLADLLALVRGQGDPSHLDRVLKGRLASWISFTLQALKEALMGTPLGKKWRSFYKELVDHGAECGASLSADLPGSAWEDLPYWQEISKAFLTKKGSVRKQLGPKNGFYSGFDKTPWAEEVKSLPEEVVSFLNTIRTYPPPGTSPVDLSLLFDLILLIGEVVERYRSRCFAAGVVDFVELELGALRVLGNEEAPTDLQLHLDRRISHILVDEFQDTSWNQWLLIRSLCAGWSPGDGRTLFLVGDPKQSIYGFRKAEVALFLRAKKGLPLPGQGLLPLKAVTICTNLRSRKELVAFTNDLFAQTIMTAPRPEADEVPFQAAEPKPHASEEGPGIIRMALFRKGEDPQGAREKEAAWLAREVEKAAQDPTAEKVGVLLLARTHLPFYLRALYERGLQVRVQEGLLLAERPEVQDLLSLTRALIRPHDDAAWAALVRSCFCWLGVQDLYAIARGRGASFAERLFSFAEQPQAPEELKRLTEVLKSRQDQVGRLPWHRLLQEIWEGLSGPEKTAERYGPAGVRNGREFLGLLSQAEKGVPEETLKGLEFLLEKAYAPPDPFSLRSKVVIMTVHQAKGLDFDIVFLPHLDRSPLDGPRENPPFLLERLPIEGEEYLLALRPDRRKKDDLGMFDLLKKLNKDRRLGEAKRLYYVALTRAKKALYFSGVISESEKGRTAPDYSLLNYLLSHPGLDQAVHIENDPEGPKVLPVGDQEGRSEDPPPLTVIPEPVPYRIVLPSGIPEQDPTTPSEEYPQLPVQEESDNLSAMAKGTVIHRILEDLAEGRDLPTEKAISRSLVLEGVEEETAEALAPLIVEEVNRCLKDPFLVELLRSDHPFSASEYALEDVVDDRTLRSGVIDRLVYDGDTWTLVDYKTTPVPQGVKVETFLAEQKELYRPQLLAYREMLARTRSLDPKRVRLFLYFTALQKAVEIPVEQPA